MPVPSTARSAASVTPAARVLASSAILQRFVSTLKSSVIFVKFQCNGIVQLWSRMLREEGSGLTGLLLVIIIYGSTIIISCFFVYEYLVHVHHDGKIVGKNENELVRDCIGLESFEYVRFMATDPRSTRRFLDP